MDRLQRKPVKVTESRLNDVGDWGDKECHSGMYSEPLRVAGEKVDIDKLPKFGSDKPRAPAKAPVRAS